MGYFVYNSDLNSAADLLYICLHTYYNYISMLSSHKTPGIIKQIGEVRESLKMV